MFSYLINRKQFPAIINAAYWYVINKTALYLRKPLPSTGFPPHFGVAIDKSTPHRDTNQAIVLLLPSEGKRVAMPVDAPLVYTLSDSNALEGGAHIELSAQIFDVLTKKLRVDEESLHYLGGNFLWIE